MAGKSNVIRVSLMGDASDLNRELDKVETNLKDLDGAADTTGDKLGSVGDKADASEQRIMGLRDMVDGTAAVMKGPGADGISAYLQGWADMASGVVNFVVPSLKMISGGMLQNIKDAAAATAATVANVGKQIAQWVMLGVQSMLHAAKVAAAWLIAMGPIALVIAAVVGLVAIIVANWDTIKKWIADGWEWVKDKTRAFVDWIINVFTNWTIVGLIIKHWDKIKDAAVGVKDWVIDKFQALVDWFKELPGKIGDAVAGAWDGLKNGFRNALNWIIDKWNNFKIEIKLPAYLGGSTLRIDTPNIPRLHSGGIFHAPPGATEGLALLQDGERVTRAGAVGADVRGGNTYHLTINALDPQSAARAVVEALQAYERNNGAIPVSVRAS